jgi:hypothetical protein
VQDRLNEEKTEVLTPLLQNAWSIVVEAVGLHLKETLCYTLKKKSAGGGKTTPTVSG